ncbi:cystathionine beta-lyase [Streptomyces sp. NBC_00536]|uniref:cystathionine beta-lyase n=1 Tax=Streptomyces sp. NBC_00536 TaxID=2975769 RepID=UPI002E819E6C|nr:cystathionine beta-lyase [Streptomyces sp. NBC_00536]WUC79953.1 cystathionine beta-lyase [Streptomyces sp. NBC_00536]
MNDPSTSTSTSSSRETRLVHAGSDPRRQSGYVNPPVYRASTALYQDVAEMDASQADPLKRGTPVYGRFGTPTGRAFEEALTELEGGHAAVATCSGLSAITTAILAYVRAGDHILVSDSVYLPTRKFCDSLAALGVETEYYPPDAGGAAIEALIRPRTRLLYLESPGSTTFEVQDIPAVTAVCRARGVVTIADNTWATPAFCRPLALGAGVDAVVHSATKYLTGHADSLLGAIVCTEESYPVIRGAAIRLGQCAGADDVYLGLRGLRTLGVRLGRHQEQGLELARWTAGQEGVVAVLNPGLPGDPGHDLWRRDFTGAAGLFGVELEPGFGKPAVDAMLGRLRVFGLGHSYGGYESLIVPADPVSHRLPGTWAGRGPLVRVHVGFESLDDLKKDLTAGFEALLSSPREP